MESKYRQRGGSMQGITSFVLVSAATILLWPGTVSGQRVITGTITDSGGARIPYATVVQGARRTVADDSGRFRFSVNSGRGFLYVRRIGYRRADLAYDAGGDTTIVVVLTPVARQLEGQVIEAVQISRALELRGFYRRLHDRQNGTNAGQFITAEEIEQRNPHRISQMFDGRTGIRMQRPNQNPGMSRRQTASGVMRKLLV